MDSNWQLLPPKRVKTNKGFLSNLAINGGGAEIRIRKQYSESDVSTGNFVLPENIMVEQVFSTPEPMAISYVPNRLLNRGRACSSGSSSISLGHDA